MKRINLPIILTLIILINLILISCSSDSHDIEEGITTSSLVGKWMLIDGKSDYYDVVLNDCDKKSYIQFNSDGTYKRLNYYEAIQELGHHDCLVSNPDDYGTYVYNPTNHTLTITFIDTGSPNSSGTITEYFNNVEITENTLSYSWDESGDGVSDYKVTYKK